MRIRCLLLLWLILSSRQNNHGEEPLVDTRHTAEVTDLVFLDGGNSILSTSLKEDRIWSTKDGRELGKLTGRRGHAIAVSKDQKYAAIAGFRELNLFSLKEKKLLVKWPVDFKVYQPPYHSALRFDAQGKHLVTTGDYQGWGQFKDVSGGRVSIISSASGKEILAVDDFPHGIGGITYSPDHILLAVGTVGVRGEVPKAGELHLLDSQTGSRKWTVSTKVDVKPGSDPGGISDLIFSADGDQLIGACSDGFVRVWTVGSGRLLKQLDAHHRGVTCLALSPDGQSFATAGRNRIVKVWSSKTDKVPQQFKMECSKINTLTWHPEGTHLAAGGGDFLKNGMIVVWPVKTK